MHAPPPSETPVVDDGLGAPPPDVQRLLDEHGAALPHYFDAHRLQTAQDTRADWPRLWRLLPDP